MIKTGLFWGTLVLAVIASVTAFTTYVGPSSGAEEFGGGDCVSAELVADYVHTVIEADRTLYTTLVVERMQDHGKVIASQYWKDRGQLPLPAQMLLLAGLEVEGKGTGLKYRLASLWPIEEENGPATDFERAGLEVVADDPSEVYSGIIKRGKVRYFKALYADKAVSNACVQCHNGHLLSPKRNYKLNDVMGGVIVSFPLK